MTSQKSVCVKLKRKNPEMEHCAIVKSMLVGGVKERMTAYVEVLQDGWLGSLKASVQEVVEG
jgi:hypothetical protein